MFTKDGSPVACTVLEAEPNFVEQLKTKEVDGYEVHGFNDIQTKNPGTIEKRVTNPLLGHFKKAGLQPRLPLADVFLAAQGQVIWETFGSQYKVFAIDVEGAVPGAKNGHFCCSQLSDEKAEQEIIIRAVALLKKYTIQGHEMGVQVSDELHEATVHSQLIKDYIIAIRHNARQWSANTKRRHEVNHFTKKPHPQKGQGRARQVLILGEGSFVEIGLPEVAHKISIRSDLHENMKKSLRNIPVIPFMCAMNTSGYYMSLAQPVVVTESVFKELEEWLI
ncbi:hypothetical protein ACTFIW_012111 [Dictyostelium discoideum]